MTRLVTLSRSYSMQIVLSTALMAATAAPAVAQTFDGIWSGMTGQNLTLSFTVVNGAVTSFSYAATVPGGGCTSNLNNTTNFATPVVLQGSSFAVGSQNSTPGGASFNASGNFSTPVTASGTLTVTVNNAVFGPGCPGLTTTNWNATRTGVAPGPGAGLQFVPLVPCRILDTRNSSGMFGGPFLAGGTGRIVPIQSSPCGIPTAAQAYSLNITVVPRSSPLGYLTVWPAGQPQPTVSTLNSPDGSILANAAIVGAGTTGAISVFATNDTDVVIDINGYFAPPSTGSLQFYPLAPCRVLDTRNANGNFGGPFLTFSRAFTITSSACSVPSSAQAFSFNVTVVPHGPLGYLTAWPTGQAQPLVSTLNSVDGTVLANAAIVPAGAGGSVSFYASDATDLVVDINGYFAPPANGLNFYPLTPCRIADTRNPNGPLGGPIMTAGFPRTFPVPMSACGLPTNAAAYSLNMTVVPQGPLGFLTTWATGLAQPAVSTLNALKGIVIANAAVVPAGAGGSIDVFVTNTTHVIIDTNGYFQ